MFDIVQIHPNDSLGRDAIIRVLNQHHDGRIRQKCIDFHRHDYKKFIEKQKAGGEVVFMVGIEDNVPIAISMCAILRKENRAINSLTIVDEYHRKRGVGQSILAAKLLVLRWIYPEVAYSTYVGKRNRRAIKMCDAVGLAQVGEGKRDREDKRPTSFYVYSFRNRNE